MISSVQFAFATQTAYSIINSSSNKCKDSSPNGTTAGSANGGDSADLSGPAKLYGDLKQLAADNPAKFKEVASNIATSLNQAAGAGGSGGAGDAQLADLAARFTQAAQTGDTSALQPSSGANSLSGVGTYNQQGHLTPATSHDSGGGLGLNILPHSINQGGSIAAGGS